MSPENGPSMEQFENPEANSIRQEAQEIANWQKQFELHRLQELYDAVLTADEQELMQEVSDPNNTDEFLIMHEDKRKLVRAAFEKLKAAV